MIRNLDIDRLAGLRIGVVGDLMLDRFIRGGASRLSPEAPVPVVAVDAESEHPGGAANVADNLVGLGVRTSLFGVIGADRDADHLRALLDRRSIDHSGLLVDATRPTTVKIRVIADGQHIVRADRESIAPLDDEHAARLIASVRRALPELDGIILQDYNKGLFTSRVITEILAEANARNVPTFVDPKRDHFFDFRGATLFKPNRKEVEDALGIRLSDPSSRQAAVNTVKDRLACANVVMTLGADGMIYRAGDADPIAVPTHASQVADVSGAGDTVIAMLAAVVCAAGSIDEAVHLANIAAGIVCGRVGTVAIDRELLLEHFTEHAARIDAT